LPAPLLLVALGRSRRRLRWAAPVGAVLLIVAVVCMGATLLSGGGAKAADGSVEAAAAAPVQPQQGPGEEYLTRVITYTYDPLHRLTGAEYSTGERYEYAYDAVGNRTVYTGTTPLAGTAVTTYTYDAANRLLISSSPQRLITYTWDARGNLIGDGTFTYAYNAAGKMVRAQSITATIAYTYTADGLRVGQRVSSTLTTYTWDWASPVPELLSQSTDSQSTAYLVGHETLGWWDGTTWAYILPDALGSVRQMADGAGVVVSAREWTPYGEEVGGWRAGLGYTGEWQDADVGLVYLRARWYAPGVGIFTAPDPFPGVLAEPGSLHPYLYVLANPVNTRDPVESFKIVPGPSLKKSYLSRPRPGRTLARRKRSGETKADTVPIPEVLPLPSGPLSLPPEWADAREEDPLSAERPVPRSENAISTSCRA